MDKQHTEDEWGLKAPIIWKDDAKRRNTRTAPSAKATIHVRPSESTFLGGVIIAVADWPNSRFIKQDLLSRSQQRTDPSVPAVTAV
jgi:hypothetical protein